MGSVFMLDLTPQINLLAERAYAIDAAPRRKVIAIAGPPGSGKSTLAHELARRLTAQKCPAVVVPMDGFHLDNTILDARGLTHRKGAPETFDSAGFAALVRRLPQPEEIVFPIFDRERDIAIAGAGVVPADCPVVIVEGNYLLLNQTPWRDLSPFWSLSVWLDVPPEDLRARLIQRWLNCKFSRVAATRRAEQNDMPNAQLILENSAPADIQL